jgi:hypothetical protein
MPPAREVSAARPFRSPSAPVDRDRLGPVLAVHGRSKLARVQPLGALVLLVLGASVCALVALAPEGRDGPAVGTRAVLTVLSGAPFAFGVWQLVRSFRARDLRVELHRDGFVHRRAGVETVILWNEVREVLIAAAAVNGVQILGCTVATANGRKVVLTREVDSVHALRTAIEKETTRRLAPTAERQLADGAVVAFGPFMLTSMHIAYKGRELPWSAVAGVSTRNGMLHIDAATSVRGTTAWAKVPYATTPNAETLRWLVEGRAGARAP